MNRSQSIPSSPLNEFNTVLRTSSLPTSTILAKIAARVVDTKDTNGADHGQAFENPEQPLGSERVTIHPFGELTDPVDAADLFASVDIAGGLEGVQVTYHDQGAGYIYRQHHIVPAVRGIVDSHLIRQDVEPTEHAEEERKGDKLKGQASDEDISTNLFVRTLPVVGTCDARAAALDEKGDDVTGDKDGREASAGDLEDAVPGWGKHGKDETADEEVVTGRDEDGGKHGKGEGHDKGALGC